MFRLLFIVSIIGTVFAENHELPEKMRPLPFKLTPELLELDCFTDEAPCSDGAQYHKDLIPMWVKDGCASCDPLLKYYIFVIVETVRRDYPEAYQKITHIYDPTGAALEKFGKEMKDKMAK